MRRTVLHCLQLTIFVYGLALISAQSVAQMIDNPTFGDFEISTAGSLEQDLLNQIRLSGQVAREDFPRLTRLIMLETYAMHQNVRADLRTTQIGASLQDQALALLTTASSFDAYVRDAPATAPFDSEEMRTRLSEMLGEYRVIESSLGQMPGFSPGAARHFTELTQLLSVVNAVVTPTASNTVGPQSSISQNANSALLGRLIPFVRALGSEFERIDLSRETPANSPAPKLNADQTNLVRLVTTFQRLLASEPAMTDVVDAWRVIRTRTWAFERRIRLQQDHPDWQLRWQTVRRRFDAVSDELRLPRVIITTSGPRIIAAPDETLIGSIDLCLESASKWMQRVNPSNGRDRVDTALVEDLRHLETKLLVLRIATLASMPVTRASPVVSDLDAISRSIRRRSQRKSSTQLSNPASGDESARELQRSVGRIFEQISS